MKKTKKSGAGNKRRQKESRQARLGTERDIAKETPDRLSREHEIRAGKPVSPRTAAARQPQREEAAQKRAEQKRAEQKRKLWERKQAELEARWLAAQARQTDEDAERKRTIKIACGMVGAGMVALLCILAWYFLNGDTPVSIAA